MTGSSSFFREAKMDLRYKSYPDFKYLVEPWNTHSLNYHTASSVKPFFELRQWCVETWGPAEELEIWKFFKKHGETVNPNWCFDVNTTNQPMLRIYFRTDAEYALYKLKWS